MFHPGLQVYRSRDELMKVNSLGDVIKQTGYIYICIATVRIYINHFGPKSQINVNKRPRFCTDKTDAALLQSSSERTLNHLS
jgi:hypothetical protein